MSDPDPRRSSGGLLLAAVERGEHVAPVFAPVDVGGGLTVSVATDALRASLPDCSTPLRLPASYAETVAICRALGCLPPTVAISDATWRAATVRVPPRPLVMTPADALRMATVEWTLRHNVAIEGALRGREIGESAIVADVGKDWILDNGLSVRGAVNYGWRGAGGVPLQSVGHAHDKSHWDYSQVLRPVCRWAALGGETVDLLEALAARGLEARWLAPYR